MTSILGLTVARQIPPKVITGLLRRQYTLDGGVIRWAAGTQHAGQIVQHLVPVVGQSAEDILFAPVSGALEAANFYQLSQFSVATQQVLRVATTMMALSGLNLAVGAVGFGVLGQKLKRLEGRLSELQEEVRSIRELLELEERAKLGAALRDLQLAMQSRRQGNHKQFLFNAKNVLAPINLKYRELWAKADTLEAAMAYEEFFSLTSLAYTRCLAELEMLDIARRNLEDDTKYWKGQARRVANEYLLGEHPERFLFSDFVEYVPVSVLVEWLDFASGDEKGYEWVDELRSRTTPWYSRGKYTEVGKKTGRAISSLGKMLTRKATSEMDREKRRVIPSLQKIVARSNVLDGYVAQYELLEQNDVTPSQFQEQLAQVETEVTVDGYLILQPAVAS
jgi:hypothetical protein